MFTGKLRRHFPTILISGHFPRLLFLKDFTLLTCRAMYLISPYSVGSVVRLQTNCLGFCGAVLVDN